MSAAESENRNFLARPRTLALGAVLLAALGQAPLRAQDDVAKAARQARERKAAQQNAPRHVYTEEELKRAKILTSEDSSRAVASRKVPASPAKPGAEVTPAQQEKKPELNPEQNTQQVAQQNTQQDTQQDSQTPSLGEIARRYRQEKEARQAQQAAKAAPPSRYPLDLPQASFAAPKAFVSPAAGSLREDEMRPLHPKFPGVPSANGSARISPFAPRREMPVPSRPPNATPSLASAVASLQRKQVQPGESWWRLAHRYLGDGARWPELLRVNPGLNPDPTRLQAGTIVFVPQTATTGKGPPGLKIVVRAGDSLWSLAREHLGCGHAWPKLAAANPELINVNQLQIGAKLRIPDGTRQVCPAR